MADDSKGATNVVTMTQADIDNLKAALAEAAKAGQDALARAAQAEERAMRAESQAAEAIGKANAAGLPAGTPGGHPENAVLEFSGSPGLPFAMYGEFKNTPGNVTLNGRIVVLTSWKPGSVKGTVPVDLPKGPVQVAIDGKAVKAPDGVTFRLG